MTPISYVKGDATNPLGGGKKVIAHCCNDLGRWGKGFVMALSRRWEQPEAEYRGWHQDGTNFALGAIQLVQVGEYVCVANMIGQHGIKAGSKGPPIRYDAIRECMAKLAVAARDLGASVHMPRIGCGLAGGRWELVEPLILETLGAADVPVTVYDFE
jgi:O-acetyl-ADP-ribose deacetylase (regulator of RNase III)